MKEKTMPEIIAEIEKSVDKGIVLSELSAEAQAEVDRETECVNVLTDYILSKIIEKNTAPDGIEPEEGTKTLFRRIATEQARKFYQTYRLEEYLRGEV